MPRTMQAYNDGAMSVYRVKGGAPYGRVLEGDLELVAETLRYADRKTGLSRFWAGWAAGEKIEKVARVPLRRDLELTADLVVKLYGASARTDAYYTVLQAQTDAANGWVDLSLGVKQIDQG